MDGAVKKRLVTLVELSEEFDQKDIVDMAVVGGRLVLATS